MSHKTTLKSYPPETQSEPSSLKLQEDIDPSWPFVRAIGPFFLLKNFHIKKIFL